MCRSTPLALQARTSKYHPNQPSSCWKRIPGTGAAFQLCLQNLALLGETKINKKLVRRATRQKILPQEPGVPARRACRRWFEQTQAERLPRRGTWHHRELMVLLGVSWRRQENHPGFGKGGLNSTEIRPPWINSHKSI